MTSHAAPPSLKLTEWTSCGGCAAKWGGAPLAALLENLGTAPADDLLFGLAPFDDAAVYRLTPDLALVSTTDFFPPLVDDPADFGAIAAANACSDVFAMGGRVLLALNIAAFPEDFPPEVIATIMAAASDVVVAAGGSIAGGHTIRSVEPIFGLAVQGTVHPDRVWHKGGARPGDKVLLSKPIGSGIVLAGGDPESKSAAISVMRSLNRVAADQLHALVGRDPSAIGAVTDVTGFGLAGHAWEIAERSDTAVTLWANRLPLYTGASAAAEAGTRTGGHARNRDYLGRHFTSDAPETLQALAIDPQTSGGLLVSIAAQHVTAMVSNGWWEVGEVFAGEPSVMLAADSG